MAKKKSIICLFVAVLAMFFAPVMTSAKEAITVYLFRGETCPHCEEALKFFEKLKKDNEYKDLFELRHLEIWNNKDYSDLANQAAEKMGESAINGSVPYIVIGEKTFKGYSSGSDANIKSAIKEAYNDNNYEDKIKDIVGNAGEILVVKENGWVTAVVILIVAVLIVGGTVCLARQGTEEEEKTEKKEEIKATPKESVEEKENTNNQPQKDIQKKTTTKKNQTKAATKKKPSTKKNSKKNNK